MALNGNDHPLLVKARNGLILAKRASLLTLRFLCKISVQALRFVYFISYLLGVRTISFFKHTGRFLKKTLTPVGRLFYFIIDRLILRHTRLIWKELCSIGSDFLRLGSYFKNAFCKHPSKVFAAAFVLPFKAVCRHKRAVASVLNLAAPLLSLAFLFNTLQHWSGLTFALSVESNGETLGYITDESVYDAAASLATERVINTDNSFEVERTPKMTLAVATKSDILSENAMCDKILRSAGDSIADVCGLYIDGKFEGAVNSRFAMQGILDTILNKHCKGSSNERAEFLKDVKIVDGLYPVSAVVTPSEMQDKLTQSSVVERRYIIVKGDSMGLIAQNHNMSVSELRALNPQVKDDFIRYNDELIVQRAQPYLGVKVIRTLQYNETIPFSTIKEENKKQYTGYSKIKIKGVTGKRKIVADVTYIDGIEQDRKILESTVTQKPVDQIMIVGTKKYSNDNSFSVIQGDGVSQGSMYWPAPGLRQITSRYSYYHPAVDITGSGAYGHNIVAADGGTVVVANTNQYASSYGKYVVIDHGNGTTTLYAHASSLKVVVGQKVSRGQVIAKVGNTGRSYGSHLHFEVRVNGRPRNPLNFI